MTGRAINRAYDALIRETDEEYDLIGMIGYALYKHAKRRLIANWREQNGRDPSDEEQALLVAGLCDDHQLGLYRNTAADILAKFSIATIEQREAELQAAASTSALVKDMKQSISDKVRPIEDRLDRMARSTSFWPAIGMNAIGSLIYSFVLLVLLLFATNYGSDLTRLLETKSVNAGAAP